MNRAALCVIFSLCACSAKPVCDATQCATGCCDGSGECQPGTEASACGSPGSGTCSVCAAARVCRAFTCVAPVVTDAGTGGGSGGGFNSGGGAGGGGGAGAAGAGGGASSSLCASTRTLANFAGPLTDAGFNQFNWMTESQPAADGGFDQLSLELYFNTENNQPVPGVSMLDGGDDTGGSTSYSNCGVCSIFFEGCTRPLSCQRAYLGIFGTIDIAQVTRDVPCTSFTTVSNLTMVEWDFGQDAPAAGRRCVVIGAATFDAGW